MIDSHQVRSNAAWFEHGVSCLMMRCGIASIAVGAVAGLVHAVFELSTGQAITGMTLGMASVIALLGQLTGYEARQRAKTDAVNVDPF